MFSEGQKSLLWTVLVCSCTALPEDYMDNYTTGWFENYSNFSSDWVHDSVWLEEHHTNLTYNFILNGFASAPSYEVQWINISSPFLLPEKSHRNVRVVSEEARMFLNGSLSTILIPSFYTLVCVFSVPINICALLVLARRIKPKNPAVIFMLNLTCADLLFAMVLPFKISYHFNGNNWIFGPTMCRVVTAAFFWNMYCSVLLITCISVDRLLAVVYPMESLAWRSTTKAIIACVAMWVLSFLGSLHLLYTKQTVYLEQLNITTCHDVQGEEPIMCYKMYFTILCFVLFFLPLIITAVSYIRLILTLNRLPLSVPGSSKKRRRAVVLAVIVLVMFVLCFTPTNFVLIIHNLLYTAVDDISQDNPDHYYVVYLMFLSLSSLNCLLDPLVYFFGSSNFKKELYSFLRGLRFTKIASSIETPADPSSSNSQTNQKSAVLTTLK